MFNGIAIWPPVNLWVLSWWGSPHTLSITDVSFVSWFHLKVFTALFLISEGTADIEIRGLPVWGIVSTEGGVWEQKNKDKELNHRHFIGLRLTDVELDLLDQGAACLSITRSEYLRKLLLEKQINHQIEVVADSLHENNPDKEFDELRFAVDDDGTNILIIINKGEITGAVDIDNMYEFASSHYNDFKDLHDDEDIVINRE